MSETLGVSRRLPLIGFVGYSDSGKTTLAAEVVRRLERHGLRVAVAKHDGHGHYKEAEGSDSARYRSAGASSVAVLSPDGMVIYRRQPASSLEDWVALMEREAARGGYDVLVAEGFKRGTHPKIAVARSAADLDVLRELGPGLLAVACSADLFRSVPEGIRRLPVDDPDLVADYILRYIRGSRTDSLE